MVNVASQCGFTPQYKELAELDNKYRSKGLVILGFPCNQVTASAMEQCSTERLTAIQEDCLP